MFVLMIDSIDKVGAHCLPTFEHLTSAGAPSIDREVNEKHLTHLTLYLYCVYLRANNQGLDSSSLYLYLLCMSYIY